MVDTIVNASDESFNNDVIENTGPVLVDFWAEWCGPCKALAPVLADIATEYGDSLKIVKVNIEDCPSIPPKYAIRAVPTLMIFKGGVVEGTKAGSLNKSELIDFIEENI